LNAELANGRLAMMAIIGMFFQDGLTGSAWGDWSLYTKSPLRALGDNKGQFGGRGERLGLRAAPSGEDVDGGAAAPSGEAADGGAADFDMTLQYGVTAPVGKPGLMIWDPIGLAKNIDAGTFRQYRSAELKHGRISMLATLGLLAQHSWKLPKFQSEPSGIEAATSGHVSSAGLALLILFVGIIEFNTSDEGREPGDFGDPFEWIPTLGWDANQPDELTLWRNRELNHCRLAMVGVLGTVLAEYATGLDAVDQWKFATPAFSRTMAILSFPEFPVQDLNFYIANPGS